MRSKAIPALALSAVLFSASCALAQDRSAQHHPQAPQPAAADPNEEVILKLKRKDAEIIYTLLSQAPGHIAEDKRREVEAGVRQQVEPLLNSVAESLKSKAGS